MKPQKQYTVSTLSANSGLDSSPPALCLCCSRRPVDVIRIRNSNGRVTALNFGLKSFESAAPLDMPGVVCTLIPLNLFDFDRFFSSPFSPTPSHSHPAPFSSFAYWLDLFFSSHLSPALVFTLLTQEQSKMLTYTHTQTAHMQYKWHADFSSFTEVQLLFSHSGEGASCFSMDSLWLQPS